MRDRQPFKPYMGPPSQLHPNMFQGREASGGYLSRNTKPNSDNAPSFKGKVYVIGSGWHWLAGWSMEGRRGSYLALKLTPMSDDDADRYCAPRHQGSARPQGSQQQGYTDDIPF